MGLISSIKNIFSPTWKFTLSRTGVTDLITKTPIGFDNIQLTIKRSDFYKSMSRSVSASLTFYHEAYDWLTTAEDAEGVLLEATLAVDKKNTTTGEYTNVITSKFDPVEFQQTDEAGKCVSMPLIDNIFSEKIKSREDISISYDATEDLDGNTIAAGEYKTATVLGREFGGAAIGTSYIEDEGDLGLNKYTNPDAPQTRWIMRVAFDNIELLPNFSNIGKRKTATNEGSEDITALECFYYNELGSTEFNITFDLEAYASTSNHLYVWMHKAKFNLDGSQISGTKELLIEFDITSSGNINESKSDNFVCAEGEGVFVFISINSASTDHYIKFYENTSLNITYLSEFDETECEVVFPLEVGERLSHMITGEPNSFRSTYFGRTDRGYAADGAGALIALTNGRLLRGYPKGQIQADGESTKAQLAFTFKEFFENFYKLKNISIEIVLEGGKYIVVAELQKELFKTSIVHESDTIEKGSFQRVRNNKHFYSKIIAGYNTVSSDLIGGLEEYITKIEHSTILGTYNNTLDLVCSYSAITTRIERLRRNPFSATSTNNLEGDNTIFLIEMVRNGTGFIQRTDEGIDDVIGLEGLTTYMNLGITPKSILLAHDWEINTGLYKYPNSKVLYNTSDKTTDLQILFEDESVYQVENGNVLAGSLTAPIWTGYDILLNSSISLSDHATIQADYNSLISYTSPLTGVLNYGWGIEIGTDPVTTNNNFQLMEAHPPDVATIKVLANEDDKVFETENDNEIIEVV